MSSNDGVQPPANTPREEISIDSAFRDLEKALEKTDPYGGATLPVTPASTPTSNSSRSIPGDEESMSDNSPTARRNDAFRSDSMQELWHRIEDKAARARLQSREANAGVLNRLTFHWASSLLWAGYRRPLLSNDIPLIHPNRESERLATAVQEAFRRNSKLGNKKALFSALFSVFKKEFVLGGMCRGIADVLLVLTPYTLRYLIKFAVDSYVAGREGSKGPPVWHGINYLAAVIIMLVIQTLAHNYYWYLLGVIGGGCRAVLTAAIFDKATRIEGRGRAAKIEKQQPNQANVKRNNRSEDVEDSPSGHLTNLLSVDCARVAQGAPRIHFLWTAPLSIILAITLLIVNLHTAALAGFALLLIGFALLMTAVRVLFGKRKAIDKVTEARVSLTEEVLSGIRFVKYHGWAERFAARILDLRGQEISQLQRYTAVRTAAGTISQGLPALTATLAFITYALIHSALSPPIVFSSSALFVSLRTPLIYLPTALQGCSDSAAALRRIQEYLLTEEIEEYPLDSELESAVEIHQATFAWDLTEETNATEEHNDANMISPSMEMARNNFRLKEIDLTVRRGELLAIIGSVGSGKSSLISALTGDMTKISGDVAWGADYATCPQQPWIHNATVRENILFGSKFPFDAPWYNTVLQTCSLTRDLDLLQHGDRTVLGERGIVLSGGQKQRISLARAMYSGKDVVLLDDPMSAVDANVGRAILDNAICGQMAQRTRVLCTHDMQILHRCDRILWMDQGRVCALGTFQDLLLNCPDFSDLLRDSKSSSEDEEHKSQPLAEQKELEECQEGREAHEDDSDGLIQGEEQATKSVSWNVYGALFGPLSRVLLIIFGLPMLLVGSASMVLTQLWLAWWSQLHFHLDRNTYIGIYVALAASQIVGLFLFGLIICLRCNHSSRVLHNRAVQRLLHGPIWYFDTTPLGRHIDRISSDVETIDYHLPEALRMLFVSLFCLAAMFALIIAYFHWVRSPLASIASLFTYREIFQFAIAVGCLVVILISLAIYCRATAREVKRHESVFRSVVFARFMEGLSGISTLRTYGMQSAFLLKIFNAADDANSATFTNLAVQRWLGLRQDMATIVLVLVMGVLVIVDRHSQEPAISGLVLSLMLANVQVVQVVVREWSDVESAMNSTERLHAYASTLPQEPDDASIFPAQDWPQRGEVSFSDTRMRYRPGLPEALKGVNLNVRAGEHVAIVGRTGAGKSSIVNSLFRLTEVSGGSVAIDGHDIARVPQQSLRGGAALSIIPQESLLFSGTVRSNLDPFDEHTDEDIWHALHAAGLDRTLYPSDAVLGQGANLSLGERQLLALARVLMRDARILVCDEATAALDADTDDYIQRALRRAFRDRTVLCIAHRLRTVLWYDRICVMDAGRVAELGSPLELFRRPDGIFRQMCTAMGITEEQILSAAAAAAADEERFVGEEAPLVMNKTKTKKLSLITSSEDKPPEIQMRFPSPSISMALDLDLDLDIDTCPVAEPVQPVQPVVRKRSHPGRRRRRRGLGVSSSVYEEEVMPLSSWREWERISRGLDSFVR